MEGKPNVYRDSVVELYQSLKTFSYPDLITYACGGKLVKQVTDTSRCFSLTWDYFNPVHKNEEDWVKDYNTVVKSIEFALPAD